MPRLAADEPRRQPLDVPLVEFEGIVQAQGFGGLRRLLPCPVEGRRVQLSLVDQGLGPVLCSQRPCRMEAVCPFLGLVQPAVALVLVGILQLGRQPKQMAGDRSPRAGLDRQSLIAGQAGHPEPGPGLRERGGAGKALLKQELHSAREDATVPPPQPLGLAQGRHHEAELEELAEVQRVAVVGCQHIPGCCIVAGGRQSWLAIGCRRSALWGVEPPDSAEALRLQPPLRPVNHLRWPPLPDSSAVGACWLDYLAQSAQHFARVQFVPSKATRA